MKYIIEIEDDPFVKGGKELYKCKPFNSLVFDKIGLGKLEPYNEMTKEDAIRYLESCGWMKKHDDIVADKAFIEGTALAWEGARMANKQAGLVDFLGSYDMNYFIDLAKAKRDEIRVGDEVRALDDDGEVYVVTIIDIGINQNLSYYRGIDGEGRWHSRARSKIAKTGRHFDAVDDLFITLRKVIK